MSASKEIICDSSSPLFDKTNMLFKEFPSDYRQVRYFTLLIVQAAPPEIREKNVLEQQISEFIKNAVKHGNKCDTTKKIRVWYLFTSARAHIIIEDEGEGFTALGEWNAMNRKRQECLESGNFAELPSFMEFRTNQSDENDAGSSLFTAVEYWNGGIAFNDKKNAVAALKKFAAENEAAEISEL